MLFNSLDFILFFLVFSCSFFLLPAKSRWVLLLLGSYFFYMYWKWEFIFLILLSTGIDFFCGIEMSKRAEKNQRRPFLLLSLFSNLGILFFFKYFNFFTDSLNELTGSNISALSIILPMGISFYTFQTLSYSIDVYRGEIPAEKHLGRFALYVSFFPQLVAGPIERASRLLPQFQKNDQKPEFDRLVTGLTQMVIGLFKKVVVADTIAIYVNHIYGFPDLYTGFTLLFATYLFAIQIYCDFSGYTDIAIGAAKMLGYDLMENFRTPYFSTSITEFWRRWHISLSTWLRDYLYIPLGGNRGGKIFTYRNLMITMLLGGLWHGASWNFVFWGLLHGVYLSVERLLSYKDSLKEKSFLIKFPAGILTFHLVCFSWIFFRAETFAKASSVISGICTLENFWNLQIKDTSVFGTILIAVGILVYLDVFLIKRLQLNLSSQKKMNRFKLIFVKSVLLLLIALFGVSEGSQFIYFQF